MPVITTIEDLRLLAKQRVPKMFYDYADSGSWTEQTYRENSSDFEKIRLRQRIAVDMEGRNLATKMAGEDVTMPVALAPTGLTGMQHADGEILAAKAAEAAGKKDVFLRNRKRVLTLSLRRLITLPAPLRGLFGVSKGDLTLVWDALATIQAGPIGR